MPVCACGKLVPSSRWRLAAGRRPSHPQLQMEIISPLLLAKGYHELIVNRFRHDLTSEIIKVFIIIDSNIIPTSASKAPEKLKITALFRGLLKYFSFQEDYRA